ncbi:Asp/Glu/hydantoin racemase [Thioclava dalianensis]|uniref:Asp/Glu/hydantoin racemase n=1 Tax=Thioclava dalianensis TaxID=1185766 RepID=A0A074TKC4_9RHOB|nr:aspartate/glutamate racemase family protein [Thioclava dalianensis]KEP69438.1 Asp/Glu/hydantoin racemase [Thioclava dalianensis]SFN02703.1 maleate isomerase [Thioclava dalianensis]
MSLSRTKPVRLGMLTPSSNTVLEPYTSAMLSALGDQVTAHFGRFRVVEISLSRASQDQFHTAPILEAAERLAEAQVDVIAWNGTSASWLGLEQDRNLCAQIEAKTGVRASSTILAYDALLRGMGVTRLGLVTPYLSEIQDRIIANFDQGGIQVVADERLEDKGNFSFATYGPAQIEGLCDTVALAQPEAIAVLCTNFRGAPIAQTFETRTGIPLLDSVSVTAAHCLALAGRDPADITGWGKVFALTSDLHGSNNKT